MMEWIDRNRQLLAGVLILGSWFVMLLCVTALIALAG